MPVYKTKNRAGKVIWGFMYSLPGASRKDRRRISQSGFATKREAADAEATRRIEEMQKLELMQAGVGVSASPPRTLAGLLEEFFAQHVDRKLAPKTIERYHEQAAYLDPELRSMPIAEINPSPSDPRVESAAGTRWPSQAHQGSSSTLGQDRAERRRGHLQRIREGDPLGTNLRQSSNQQRAAPGEEASRNRAYGRATGHGAQSTVRALVHVGFPGGYSGPWRAPRRSPRFALVGHPRRPSHHRAFPDTDQTSAGVQGD
jgi:hypothetical protein